MLVQWLLDKNEGISVQTDESRVHLHRDYAKESEWLLEQPSPSLPLFFPRFLSPLPLFPSNKRADRDRVNGVYRSLVAAAAAAAAHSIEARDQRKATSVARRAKP